MQCILVIQLGHECGGITEIPSGYVLRKGPGIDKQVSFMDQAIRRSLPGPTLVYSSYEHSYVWINTEDFEIDILYEK